jgi:NitT/TauT family transport system permease protein
MKFDFIRKFDYRKPLPGFLVCVIILSVWQTASRLHIWDELIIPSPSRVVQTLWESRSDFWTDLLSTLWLLANGLVATVSLAFITAITLHLLPRLSRSIYWLFVLLQTVPLFPVAPILFYLTGPKHIFLDQVVTIVLAAFFPILKRVDSELMGYFDSLDATRLQKLLYLEIPTAVHMVIAGAKITVTMCVVGTFFAETLVGEMKGLGFRIKYGDDRFNVSLVFASLLILAVVSASTYWIVSASAKLLQPWRTEKEHK